MFRFVCGSVNVPKFSHMFVAGSSRRICARSEFFTQTLPSTFEKVGDTNDCCVASVCHSFGTDHVCTLPVLLSSFATPPWYMRPTQRLPSRSLSRSSVPTGNPSLMTGIGYSVTLPVFGSILPRNIAPKSEYQTMPSRSRMTSCGSMFFRGKSYSVTITRVARPVGRGSVLSM